MQDHKVKISGSIISLFIRIFWMFIGSGLLFIVFALSMATQIYSIKLISIIYWIVVLSLIVARFIDIRFFKGQTVDGEPASMSHWRKYAVVLGTISLLLWITMLFFTGTFTRT